MGKLSQSPKNIQLKIINPQTPAALYDQTKIKNFILA
jgi:hypothetical protein